MFSTATQKIESARTDDRQARVGGIIGYLVSLTDPKNVYKSTKLMLLIFWEIVTYALQNEIISGLGCLYNCQSSSYIISM